MTELGAHSAIRLPVVSLPGPRPSSLGNYLATLGVLRVAARSWSRVRLAWRDGIPCLVSGPESIDELAHEIAACARNQTLTSYKLGWYDAQMEAKKLKQKKVPDSGVPVAHWRADADEAILSKLDAHIVPGARLFFNPLLGSGGNAGKRKFADGWEKAAEELRKKLASKQHAIDTENELRSWLKGEVVTFLMEKLQAASWFSDANKLFNSGQSPAREGQISPWAMVLACEGLDLFAGGVSRRLGVRTRALGAFPFVTGPAAPTVAGEAGHDRGEVWAPLWARPATLAEVRAIFSRGRAEIGSRGALTPAAFATAILRRGVDAGLTSFVRFALGTTTSSNTFEPRLRGEVKILQRHIANLESSGSNGNLSSRSRTGAFDARAEVVERSLDLWETLPRDTKTGKRWQFRGLRGPVEAAMVALAEKPEDASRARTLADAVVAALDRVDRNRAFRKAGVRWRPLPLHWLPILLGQDASIEARLAAAITSSFPAKLPFTLYRFGVELTGSATRFLTELPPPFLVPERRPSSWVWSGSRLVPNLIHVLRRRTFDLGRLAHNLIRDAYQTDFAMRQGWSAGKDDIEAWLSDAIDEDLLATWLGRLALFDWRRLGARPPALKRGTNLHARPVITGALALHALFLPLLDQRPVRGHDVEDLLAPERGVRTAGAAQKLVALLSVSNMDDAIRLVRARYAMGNAPLAHLDMDFAVEDSSRFAASLLMPVSDEQRARLIVQRWLRPSRRKGELHHVYA